MTLVSLLVSACAAPELATVSRHEDATSRTLFRDVAVFDGVDLVGRRDVLVDDGVVARVGAANTLDAESADVAIVDGEGRTLLPGLVDSHVHLLSAGEKGVRPPDPETIARSFLYAGVTTVLVTAGLGDETELRDAGRRGEQVVPHLYTGGAGLTAPEGHPVPLLRAMFPWPIDLFMASGVVTAGTVDEARAGVAGQVEERRPDFLKIIYDDLPPGSAHMSREVLEAAIDAARAHGVRAIVHTTTPEDTLTAVAAGAALLVHVPQRGMLTPTEVSRIVEADVAVVTTARLISASHELASGGPTALEGEMHGPALLEPWMASPLWDLPGFSEEIDEPATREQAVRDTAANVRRLWEGGARLLVGTDSGVHGVFPGSSLHREMRYLVALGLTPAEVLRAATSAPADFIDPEARFGRVAPGHRADLLLVRGDPTDSIDALSEIEGVWLSGARLQRDQVD